MAKNKSYNASNMFSFENISTAINDEAIDVKEKPVIVKEKTKEASIRQVVLAEPEIKPEPKIEPVKKEETRLDMQESYKLVLRLPKNYEKPIKRLIIEDDDISSINTYIKNLITADLIKRKIDIGL